MLDIKVLHSALEQLEEERKIPREKILEAIEQALAAAYKKDYGKKGQIIRATFDSETGKTDFFQVKIVVDDSLVRVVEEGVEEEEVDPNDERVRFNPEHHIFLEDAKKIKKDAKLEDEIIFPLEPKDDYGRIAAQTAKQVIIQKIREAEKDSILSEYHNKADEIISGIVQKSEHGNVFIDFNRTTGVLPITEQIPGERFRSGERIKVLLYAVEESSHGILLKISRTHPQFIKKLFEMEVPEIANGVVEIKSISREPGSRSKIAVFSNDEHIDPIGSCVGQKGIRVSTVMAEIGGEKIDIIPWSEDPAKYVSNSLAPAKVIDIEINEEYNKALVEVDNDQLSLAIGKGGQNVRLAAKLTGWRIDIKGNGEEEVISSDGEAVEGIEEVETEKIPDQNEEIKEKGEENESKKKVDEKNEE